MLLKLINGTMSIKDFNLVIEKIMNINKSLIIEKKWIFYGSYINVDF